MRLTFDGLRWNPTDGALIPHIADKGKEMAKDAISEIILSWIHDIGVWLGTHGLALASEMLFTWSMVCFLFAIMQPGKWMERGAKSILLAAMLGVAKYAV